MGSYVNAKEKSQHKTFYRILSCGLGCKLRRAGLSERTLTELHKHNAGSWMVSPANERHP